MVIYTNNLAEKLFGFAMSRAQLRDTALCGILDDPRLSLDIDLAIDFNAALRGDEDAAERFTNTLILSSAYVDYSTADFYTTRMEQYPVFEYHVDRINYIFENLDNLGDYYANSNANERSFLDKLLDGLKDCLNSPCNLFAASSESMASITDMAAKSNSSTIPTFQELKGKFKNAYGGLKTTLVKRLPDAVSDMFIELGTIGQGAWAQSVDMLYSKDPEKKKKIISNALAGKALDSDSTSYSYIPDLDAYTSVEGFATSVLSQAASELGGCFRKYQHLARYSPFNPDQNLSRTNKDPVSDNVDGKDTYRNSFGVYDWDYQNRSLNLCKGGLPGSATPDVGAPGKNFGEGNGAGDLKGTSVTATNVRINNDGVTPPSFNDPYYQNKTAYPGLDATKDYFVVVPIGSNTPLGSKVIITNPDTGKYVTGIVGDRGPVGASMGEVSFATARDLGVWSGNGDSVKSNSSLKFTFLP